MRWSYSRLNAFQQCKYGFYLNYILNNPDLYLPESNFYSENGSLCHETLEKLLKGDLDVEDAASYYINKFNEQICYSTKQSIMDRKMESCADYFANTDFDWLGAYNILGVEKKMFFHIDKKNFVAYIDLLLEHKESKDIIVVDHKSGGFPLTKAGTISKNKKQSFDGYRKQAYIYAHAVHEKYGKFPTFLCWNYFADDGQWLKIPFDENEYDETINWVKRTIQSIEQEQDYEPSMDFFYCTNLCAFRNSCEYVQGYEWK